MSSDGGNKASEATPELVSQDRKRSPTGARLRTPAYPSLGAVGADSDVGPHFLLGDTPSLRSHFGRPESSKPDAISLFDDDAVGHSERRMHEMTAMRLEGSARRNERDGPAFAAAKFDLPTRRGASGDPR